MNSKISFWRFVRSLLMSISASGAAAMQWPWIALWGTHVRTEQTLPRTDASCDDAPPAREPRREQGCSGERGEEGQDLRGADLRPGRCVLRRGEARAESRLRHLERHRDLAADRHRPGRARVVGLPRLAGGRLGRVPRKP